MEKPTFSIDEAIEWTFLYCRTRLEVLDIMLVLYSELDRYSYSEWQRFWEVVERKLRILAWAQKYLPKSFTIQIKPDVGRILIQDLKSIQF